MPAVPAISKLVNRGGIIRSSGVVGGFTMLSRALGLVRDVLMASVFGTSAAMSAFVIAFRIPNLFRRLFGEGALSSAFIPVFAEALERDGKDAAWSLARKIVTMFGLLLLGIVLLGVLLAGLARAGLPGPDPAAAGAAGSHGASLVAQARRVLPLFQILFPYMFFICLVALSMGVLNSFDHFALPAATPCLLNCVWIVALLALSPLFGPSQDQRIFGVAWGILGAGLVQLVVQLPALMRRGYLPGLSFAWRDARVRKVLLLMGPAALGMGITQINILVDNALAFFVGTWAPAALFYAERLIYFPLGIFATALGTVLLPVFSRHAARLRPDQIRATLNQSLRMLMFVMVPAAVGLLVLARPIIRLLFERHDFTAVSTMLTARALLFYAPGLVAFSLCKVFVPAFYSQQDTRTPVRIGIRIVGLNIALNLLFVITFPLYFKHAGLALATVLAETTNGVVLGYILHRRLGDPGWARIAGSILRVLGAAAVMGGAAWYLHAVLERVVCGTALHAKLAQAVAVLGTIGAAIVVYLLAAALLRCRELGEIRKSLECGS